MMTSSMINKILLCIIGSLIIIIVLFKYDINKLNKANSDLLMDNRTLEETIKLQNTKILELRAEDFTKDIVIKEKSLVSIRNKKVEESKGKDLTELIEKELQLFSKNE